MIGQTVQLFCEVKPAQSAPLTFERRTGRFNYQKRSHENFSTVLSTPNPGDISHFSVEYP